eukprot:757313-Lingulodinium_polyedra.AAC.1
MHLEVFPEVCCHASHADNLAHPFYDAPQLGLAGGECNRLLRGRPMLDQMRSQNNATSGGAPPGARAPNEIGVGKRVQLRRVLPG